MEGKYVPVPKEATYKLIELAQNGDEDAKEQLIIQNTGLVKKLALKFSSPETEYEDFVQIGYMGLLKAVYKFNTEYGVMFSTYAVPIILGEMKQYFRDNGRIKVSRSMKSDIQSIKAIRERHLKTTGKEIRIGEIADEMKTSKEHVLEIIAAEKAVNGIASLDSCEFNPESNQAGVEADPEDRIDWITLKAEIGKLPELQKKVISLRYCRDLTQREIAKMTGISQVQVSRIEKKAIENIKEKICCNLEAKIQK